MERWRVSKEGITREILADEAFVLKHFDTFELIEEPPEEKEKKPIGVADFFDRFTDDEFLAVLAAIKVKPKAEAWMERLKLRGEAVITNERFMKGMDFLLNQEILTQQRYDKILDW